MIDPYDVIEWHADRSSESSAHVLHWQEQDEMGYGRACYQCLVFINRLLALLALCAVVYALLR